MLSQQRNVPMASQRTRHDAIWCPPTRDVANLTLR